MKLTGTTICMLVIVTLAGCNETTKGTTVVGDSSRPNQACLGAVARNARNPDVAVVSSSPSETGTKLILEVGPQKARWECTANRNGTISDVLPLPPEDALIGAV